MNCLARWITLEHKMTNKRAANIESIHVQTVKVETIHMGGKGAGVQWCKGSTVEKSSNLLETQCVLSTFREYVICTAWSIRNGSAGQWPE